MKPFSRDFWNERFASEAYLYGTHPSMFLRTHVHHLAEASEVLVPADGEGRNSVFLATLGHSVVATDISDKGIAKARALAQAKGASVDFRHLDLQGWDWPEASFDAVVGIFIQFAPPAFRDELFDGMKRAVRPGGVVLLHGYTPKQLDYGTGGPPVASHLYTEDLLRDAFGDWHLERLEAYEHDVEEGTGHKGRSALIDLIARRPIP